MSTGSRCGANCGSSTISPATVYFPQGYAQFVTCRGVRLTTIPNSTYLISDSIPLYYYTEVIGDARNPPTILAAANYNPSASAIFGSVFTFSPHPWSYRLTGFSDADPYIPNGWGAQWYVNQNNL